jgi:phosphate/sulfate permease
MQGFHCVALRKDGVIADPCFRKYVCSGTVCGSTTLHGANDVQHNITLLGVVMSLWESGPET